MLEKNSDSAAPPCGFVWHVEMLGRMRANPVGDRTPGVRRSESDPAVDPVEQFRTHKAALLLARLALLPDRAHAREELADLLWPEATTERGRANLSQTLMYLRQALHLTRSSNLFTADHKTVRVGKGLLTSDVAEWEQSARRALASNDAPEQAAMLRAALDAYTGDLLPGFYDDWIGVERLRLAALRDDLRACLASLGDGVVIEPEPLTPVASISEPHAKATGVANAPLYLTRFFGRERECARALELFRQEPPVRLVTLLGMGGIGKTRLALRIAQLALEGDDGARMPLSFGWAGFVPLAEAFTAEQVEGLLLQALGFPNEVADGLAAIVDRLSALAARRSGQLLLLLDNLEQLGDIAAPIVARLLREVPGLTILATSRQPVGIPGERELPVLSLSNIPARAFGGLPDDICLFVDRAALVRPEFALTTENQSDVARLCAVLEGIPLALELAAGWMRVLSPGQVAARLGNRFDLLALHGVSRAVPKRHRSLHAAIAWSYDLLGPSLQAFFAQLSVFRGGWTAEAAQSVTGVKDTSEPLLILTERSLILVEEVVVGDITQTRYRMLESLREFADEQLDSSERTTLLVGHVRFFGDLSYASDQPAARRGARAQLRPEKDNLRAAISFALSSLEEDSGLPDDCIEHGIQILFHSSWIWTIREVESLSDLVTATLPRLPEATRKRIEADLLLGRGSNYLSMGDLANADRCLRASLAVSESSGNDLAAARVRGRMANLALRRGDRDDAIAIWRTCLAEADRLGDRRLQAAMHNNLAVACADLGERRAHGERAVALDRTHYPHSYFLASSLNTLANAALEQADLDVARACLDEAYALAHANGAAGTVALVQVNLAGLLIEIGTQLDRAGDLLRAARIAYEDIGDQGALAEIAHTHFQLALARRDPAEALHHSAEYQRLTAGFSLEAVTVAARRAEMARLLREAGFAEEFAL